MGSRCPWGLRDPNGTHPDLRVMPGRHGIGDSVTRLGDAVTCRREGRLYPLWVDVDPRPGTAIDNAICHATNTGVYRPTTGYPRGYRRRRPLDLSHTVPTHGQPGYLARAKAWARYFKDDYRQCVGERFYSYCRDGTNFGYDHMYGWGLLAWYEYLREQGDPTAPEYLTAAENLGTDLEAFYSGDRGVGGTRAEGRHLLLLSRLSEVTGHPRWRTLLDTLVHRLVTTGAWNDTYGTYFLGRTSTENNFGAGAHAAGIRVISAFYQGVLAEGFGAAYRVTQHPELRARLIRMAQFAKTYGPHPTDGFYPYVFGINTQTGEQSRRDLEQSQTRRNGPARTPRR